MIMRKFLLPAGIALILFIGLIFPFNVNAEETVSFWSNPETGYQVIVEDDAELLSAEEAAWLALEMQEITAYGNASFKSISHNTYSTSQFAKDYYYENFHQESGTLFLIDMYNREIYIFSDGAVYRTITTACFPADKFPFSRKKNSAAYEIHKQCFACADIIRTVQLFSNQNFIGYP